MPTPSALLRGEAPGLRRTVAGRTERVAAGLKIVETGTLRGPLSECDVQDGFPIASGGATDVAFGRPQLAAWRPCGAAF